MQETSSAPPFLLKDSLVTPRTIILFPSLLNDICPISKFHNKHIAIYAADCCLHSTQYVLRHCNSWRCSSTNCGHLKMVTLSIFSPFCADRVKFADPFINTLSTIIHLRCINWSYPFFCYNSVVMKGHNATQKYHYQLELIRKLTSSYP